MGVHRVNNSGTLHINGTVHVKQTISLMKSISIRGLNNTNATILPADEGRRVGGEYAFLPITRVWNVQVEFSSLLFVGIGLIRTERYRDDDCPNKLTYHIRNCTFYNSKHTLHIPCPASFVIEDTLFSKIDSSIFYNKVILGKPSSGLIRNTVFRNTRRTTATLGSLTIQSSIFDSVSQLKFEGWSKNTQESKLDITTTLFRGSLLVITKGSKLVITNTIFKGMFIMFTFEILTIVPTFDFIF